MAKPCEKKLNKKEQNNGINLKNTIIKM